ncbi:glutathione S-transferase, partial [Lipomyces tetrasporus]
FFQTSGQGPYYGQASWFKKFHPEQLPSALERYTKEINRVTGVLEAHLDGQKVDADSDGPWFVGNKLSYADIAFISRQILITRFIGRDEHNLDDFPLVKQWLSKMTSRKSVKVVLKIQERLE